MDEKKKNRRCSSSGKRTSSSPTNGYDRLAPGEEEEHQAYCAGYKTFLDERQDRAGVRGLCHQPGGSRRVPAPWSGGETPARGQGVPEQPGKSSCWR